MNPVLDMEGGYVIYYQNVGLGKLECHMPQNFNIPFLATGNMYKFSYVT